MSFTDLRMPSPVFTPPRKLVRDIKRYVLPSIDRRQMAWIKRDEAHWRKLVVLSERMEFVSKLEVIRKKIDKCTKQDLINDKNGKPLRYDYKCRWLKEDFAGVHKDIESLEIYLLVSAIDEMAESVSFQTPFNWLKVQSPKEIVPLLDWCKVIEQFEKNYNEKYGVTKGIKRMFMECLSKDIKDEWVDSYVALKMRRKNGEWRFEEEDYNEYLAKNREDQFELLTKALIAIRNSYTHDAFRMFECDHALIAMQSATKDKLTLLKKSKEKRDLIPLLQESVMSIAASVFCKKQDVVSGCDFISLKN